MSREDGVITSSIHNYNVTIPQVGTSAMALALYVQYQSLVNVSDSLVSQQAFTADLVDRLKLINRELEAIMPGYFDPADKAVAFQSYLDLLAIGIQDPSTGVKDYAAAYSEDGTQYFLPYPPDEISVNDAVDIDLDPGSFALVSIDGGEQRLYFRGLPSTDDPGGPPAVDLGVPRAFLPATGPDGKAWISTVEGTVPEQLTDVTLYPVVPPGTASGSYLKVSADDGSTHYFRYGVNDLAQEINQQDGKFVLFAGSAVEGLVTEWRKAIITVQSQLTDQSKVQADYMLYLLGDLTMWVNAVTNSLQRIKRSASSIIDRGVGG